MKRAIYPGSFDPITNGHLDVLKRALKIFDEVIILIASNPNKKSRFTPEERMTMIKEATAGWKGVSVDVSTGLTVKYAKEHQASSLIRGLRAVTDFEYEFQLATANDYVDDSIDSVFLMSKSKNSFINSSTVMELYQNGVDVSELVPPCVLKYLKK